MTPVVFALLLLNLIVFGMWLWLGDSPLMLDNFLISADAIAAGRWWTLVASEFSHIQFLHFFLNMYVLATFGPIVELVIGSVRYLIFYLAATVVASLSHAAVSAYLMDQPGLPALGASGAISGVIILFSLFLPRARLLLFGVIPMPAIVGALVFVGLDVVGLIAQTEGGGLPIGHGAHLGGAATGALFYFFVGHAMGVRLLGRVDYGDVGTWRRLIATDPRNRDRG